MTGIVPRALVRGCEPLREGWFHVGSPAEADGVDGQGQDRSSVLNCDFESKRAGPLSFCQELLGAYKSLSSHLIQALQLDALVIDKETALGSHMKVVQGHEELRLGEE